MKPVLEGRTRAANDEGREAVRPLVELLTGLARQLRFVELGIYPTPVEPLPMPATAARQRVFIKRDDLSSDVYGGNKVRTLEVLFGRAQQLGSARVVSTGAFGSNHALATVLHARRAGLSSGALLFPQPASRAALDNFERTVSLADELKILPHWSMLPFGSFHWRRREPGVYIMPPGGATPLGALGYVSAALELALQVREGLLPSPSRIVLPVGSCCTSAGLLVGLRLARDLGLGFADGVPQVHAVRVTPWPVTSPLRIAHLAQRTSQLIGRKCGQARFEYSASELRAGLRVDAEFLGAGYGRPTPTGRHAMATLGRIGETLDTTYSAKAAAALLQRAAEFDGVTLFWATKSSAELPAVDTRRVAEAGAVAQRWLSAARACSG